MKIKIKLRASGEVFVFSHPKLLRKYIWGVQISDVCIMTKAFLMAGATLVNFRGAFLKIHILFLLEIVFLEN